VIGLALGSYIDPWLTAHQFPVIAQQLIPGIAATCGGICGDLLAARVRAIRTELADAQKRTALKGRAATLRDQLLTVEDQGAATELQRRLDRWLADWDKGVIQTSTFERSFEAICDEYLDVTGSARSTARRRRLAGSP